jgi:hypothetical protein
MSGRRAVVDSHARELRAATRASGGMDVAGHERVRTAAAFAILVGAGVPAFAEPAALQLDALAGDAHMTGPRDGSWADGARIRLGLGARRGAWAAMVRVGIMSLERGADYYFDSHLTSVSAGVNVEWYPRPGRWEPFVSLGVHDDRTTGYLQFSSIPTQHGPTPVDPTGIGIALGAGMQLTARSDAHLAAARLEVAYTDGGMIFVGIGGELGAFVSR